MPGHDFGLAAERLFCLPLTYVTPKVQIRPAGRDDLQQILDIYNEAVLNTTASYDYEPRTIEQRQTWFEEHERAKGKDRAGRGLAAISLREECTCGECAG